MRMSEKYYTVKEALELLSISKPTLYAWMGKGKLEYKETHKGRLVLLTDQQIQEQQETLALHEKTSSKDQLNNNSETVKNEQVEPVNNGNEIILNLLNQLNDKTAELVHYAEERGKVKLLTDKLIDDKELLKQFKEESKYYQDQVFEYKYRNKVQEQEITSLKNKLAEYEAAKEAIETASKQQGKTNLLTMPIGELLKKL